MIPTALHAGSPTPYLNFRQQHLEYAGYSQLLTNLEHITFGWFGPSASPTNRAAADMWWAAQYAIASANAEGGCRGIPFRLLPCWSDDPWKSGVADLAKLIFRDKPLLVLGSLDSAATHLAEQIVAKAHLPLLSPVATDPSVTLAGVPWMFSLAPSDHAIARVLVDAILGEGTEPALISTTDHEARMFAKAVLREFSRRGRSPALHLEAQPGGPFNRQLAALAQAQPGSVLVVAGAADSADVISDLKTLAPALSVFGSHVLGRWEFLQKAGPSAAGVRFPLIYRPKATNRFVQAFAAAHQRPPDYTAALTYDACNLAIAVTRHSALSVGAVREAIASMNPENPESGPVVFDGTGQNCRTNIIIATY